MSMVVDTAEDAKMTTKQKLASYRCEKALHLLSMLNEAEEKLNKLTLEDADWPNGFSSPSGFEKRFGLSSESESRFGFSVSNFFLPNELPPSIRSNLFGLSSRLVSSPNRFGFSPSNESRLNDLRSPSSLLLKPVPVNRLGRSEPKSPPRLSKGPEARFGFSVSSLRVNDLLSPSGLSKRDGRVEKLRDRPLSNSPRPERLLLRLLRNVFSASERLPKEDLLERGDFAIVVDFLFANRAIS